MTQMIKESDTIKLESIFDGNYSGIYDGLPTVTLSPSDTAIKYDDNKTDWSLLPVGAVEEIIKVLEFGARKYDAWNFAKGDGLAYSRVLNSLLRHTFAFQRGEDLDPETGISHLAHAGCNVLFLLHFILNKDRYPNNDDRQKL